MPPVWPNLVLLSAASTVACAAAGTRVQSRDAYAYGAAGGRRWTVGTGLIEVVLEYRDGALRLARCTSALTDPPTDYVAAEAAPSLLLGAGQGLPDRYTIEPLWERCFPGSVAALDPAGDGLRVAVQAGDMLGFSEGPHGPYECDQIAWPVTLDDGDGGSYCSLDAPDLEQGPVWFYCVRRPGTGFMEFMDAIEAVPNVAEKARIPSPTSAFRAPGTTPHIGPSVMHPAPTLDAVRVWRAPRAGVVSVRGQARHILSGDVDLAVLRIREKAPDAVGLTDDGWHLEGGQAAEVRAGGRPAVQLALGLRQGMLRLRVYLLAYPGTPILRMWSEVENPGTQPAVLRAQDPFSVALDAGGPAGFGQCWLVGGNNKPDAGELRRATLGPAYANTLGAKATYEYAPWTCLLRDGGSADGWFTSLDYLSTWQLSVRRDEEGPAVVRWEVPEMLGKALKPGECFRTPLVTFGVFSGGLDGMARRVYDWQYEYLWDYTNPEFYARPMWAVGWFFCSRNLQEQFTARLAALDMDADLMRTLGFEMLWDDAGWSKHPKWPIENSYSTVFTHSYEGPDYAQTLRYLDKMGMKWLLWFCGNPPQGVLDGKVGAWGNFQWRTDAVGIADAAGDRAWRGLIESFLTANPRASFHTCSGGGTYSHTFEIQRLADVNYLSDLGRGDATNHGFSYLDIPDKWVDIIEAIQGGNRYKPETSRQLLTAVPFWYVQASEADQACLSRDLELYHYLLRQGVAGRWSYLFHPGVEGDRGVYYSQRTSHDRTRAVIILKHRPQGEVTIRPSGLIPEHAYTVELDSVGELATRTGDDLMRHGIVLRDPPPGELVYLGLPDRPGAGRDTVPPTAPGRALTRPETNLGHSGIGIHWSPGQDDRWVRGYEVRRGDQILGRAVVGTYYFDHAPGWDPWASYAVRTVDGDGNASPWTAAQPGTGEPPCYAALGGHFAEAGRDGWSAETSADGLAFTPMVWVPPAKNPAGDLGGTPNQPGGVEGYWEGPGQARVGRGWQQAATETDCVRAWRAPRAGTVRVLGRAMKEYYRQGMGTRLQVRILHNTRQVWPQTGWAVAPLNDLVGATHDLTLDVAAGDTLRFILARSPSPDEDILAWMPRLVYAQSPDAAQAPGIVRIACGASRPYTDGNGNTWSADRCASGGEAVSSRAAIAGAFPTLADEALYQSGRAGRDFTYAIPVPPGLYSLRVKFAETEFEHHFERPLSLSINGRQVLGNLDVCQAARAPHTAYDRVFRHLVPDENGLLVLRFTGGWEPTARSDQALVHALEVLPEMGAGFRLRCGSGTDFVDWNSMVWNADARAEGGQYIASTSPVTQASPTLYDQALYQTARAGTTFTYRLPLPPGLYTVHLKLAELWLQEPGQRPMDITVNGRPVRTAWDPATAAGQTGMAADVRVEGITPDQSGLIRIQVTATGANDAILQAIEVE